MEFLERLVELWDRDGVEVLQELSVDEAILALVKMGAVATTAVGAVVLPALLALCDQLLVVLV